MRETAATQGGHMHNGRVAIAVMAKAPQPGRVKTRLCPPLSPEQAAAMGAAFLRDVTGNLAAAAQQAPIDAFVAYAPAGSDARFDGMLHPGTRLLLADGEGDMPPGVEKFGRCLLQATERLLAMGYAAACVLNADSPDPADRAAGPPGGSGSGSPNRDDRAVLGSGRGRRLLRARPEGAACLGMFAGIDWSTERVAAQTRARAARARPAARRSCRPGTTWTTAPPWLRLLADLRTRRPTRRPAGPIAAPCHRARCIQTASA